MQVRNRQPGGEEIKSFQRRGRRKEGGTANRHTGRMNRNTSTEILGASSTAQRTSFFLVRWLCLAGGSSRTAGPICVDLVSMTRHFEPRFGAAGSQVCLSVDPREIFPHSAILNLAWPTSTCTCSSARICSAPGCSAAWRIARSLRRLIATSIPSLIGLGFATALSAWLGLLFHFASQK